MAKDTVRGREDLTQQVEWLLAGLEIEQKKALHSIKKKARDTCY